MSARILRRAMEDEPRIIFQHMQPLVIHFYIQYIQNINFVIRTKHCLRYTKKNERSSSVGENTNLEGQVLGSHLCGRGSSLSPVQRLALEFGDIYIYILKKQKKMSGF